MLSVFVWSNFPFCFCFFVIVHCAPTACLARNRVGQQGRKNSEHCICLNGLSHQKYVQQPRCTTLLLASATVRGCWWKLFHLAFEGLDEAIVYMLLKFVHFVCFQDNLLEVFGLSSSQESYKLLCNVNRSETGSHFSLRCGNSSIGCSNAEEGTGSQFWIGYDSYSTCSLGLSPFSSWQSWSCFPELVLEKCWFSSVPSC